jgi:hypothetical protein
LSRGSPIRSGAGDSGSGCARGADGDGVRAEAEGRDFVRFVMELDQATARSLCQLDCTRDSGSRRHRIG